MVASVIPVIYDSNSKQVLRWYILDFDNQLSDPAFLPAEVNEKIAYIRMATYETFGKSDTGFPALTDLQDYINRNVP